MAKYSAKIAAEIVELIRQDMFTISGICKVMDISRKTFYEWIDTDCRLI